MIAEDKDIDPEHFAKVTYVDDEGHQSQAYINLLTGVGTNKHSDIPVRVVWSDELDTWKLVWEDPSKAWWVNEPEFLITDAGRRFEEQQALIERYKLEKSGRVTPPHIRVQPKKLTRRQRRKRNWTK